MNFKNIFSNIFSYNPQKTEDFIIPNSPNNIDSKEPSEKYVSTEYDKNIKVIKTSYNLLINSDINLHEFEITISNKKFKSALLFIDGLVNSESINTSILSPLLLRNSIKMSASQQSKPKLLDVKKFDLKDFLLKSIITQNVISTETEFENIFNKVNSGFCALFVDSLDCSLCIEVKDLKGRSITEPQTENVVHGSHESFVENIRTNTSLLRKIINNENLVIENLNVGKITNTSVAVCYIKSIANDDLIAEVSSRINGINIDSLVSSGQLENLIKDDLNNIYPEVISTERPDRTAEFLLGGRVAILVNGSPYSLIVPALLLDFLSSSEDLNLNYFYANFLKVIRIFALFITLFLPSLYIAITIFHDEFLPSELLFAIVAAREKIPFPIIFEILLMEISFELIREAGIRVPSAFGQAIGIVGALILGEAAVTANIVSPILVIIVALTGISEFAIPDFSFSFSVRIFRFIYIILSYICRIIWNCSRILYTSMLHFNNKFFWCSNTSL